MREILAAAIRSRRVIEFDYDGHRRVGEPHLLGDLKGGLAIELYQTSGSSKTGQPPFWRDFYFDAIEGAVVVSDTPFTPRPDFDPTAKKWCSVVAHVLET